MRFIFTVVAYLIFFAINAQSQDFFSVKEMLSTSQLKQIEKAVTPYWLWENDEEPQKALAALEKITTKEEKQWLAPYWASYISTQVANSSENSIFYLDKAQSYFDIAKKRYNQEESPKASAYFIALQTLIYRLKGFYYQGQKEEEKAKKIASKARENLNASVKAAPQNPVIMVLAATDLASQDYNNLSNVIAAIALLEKAQAIFSTITDRSSADISYWNEHWITPWLKNLSPPEKN